ncbi:hypothetical protein PV10_04537 [Exophiala mesophila]|uniref:Uncharacterized protein n=1 Tax=Exophiala mesophila TaxID=212818 RepID=A0A0D1ZHL4_EXOME|nr:uncharacterized protein PV10_04537 [Exophiala mesophila]KIV93314.1 hypothetical protein PV10_04537 [Exophiala mesophila]
MIKSVTSPIQYTPVIQNPLYRPFEGLDKKVQLKPLERLPCEAHLSWKFEADPFQQYILQAPSCLSSTTITATSATTSQGSVSVKSETPICDLLVARGILPNRPVRRVNHKETQDGQHSKSCSRNGIHRVIMQLRIEELVRKIAEQKATFPRPDEGRYLSYQDYKRIIDWVPPPPAGAALSNQDFGRNMA